MQCPDRKGLVNAITGFIMVNNGNILELEQFVDQTENMFFMRVVWDMEGFKIPLHDYDRAFEGIAKELNIKYRINDSGQRDRLALFVSKKMHCLAEVILQWYMGNLEVEIPLIISNTVNAKDLAEKYSIEFLHTPTENIDMEEIEQLQMEELRKHEIELIGLARYMRILSGSFVERYPGRIINIHHSFLPAFAGADPYRQAYDRGVKIIGATSHFVTEELDQGPIIAQGIKEVHHGYSVKDLRKTGEDIERTVFLKALRKYIERKIIRHGNKTIVFE
jgi:formyltetrahydrofolate deformylase